MLQLRRDWPRSLALVAVLMLGSAGAEGQWVSFVEETATRLAGVPLDVGADDQEEKDYAWADFDHDGDDDLAVARKQPFIAAGKRTARLWINEDGVFVDRTADLATAASVPGDQGFLTPTNTRDVVAVDVDLDGWIDLVTGPAISPNDPKHIGHPRVYRNLGCTGACAGTADWRGFRFEDNRIPTMLSSAGQPGNPCLCAVAAGDLTGDGYPELWLIDYDSGEGCSTIDFNNKLLINRGAIDPGVFTDQTAARFFGTPPDGWYPNSAFGASGKIVDLNGDGRRDLVKQYAGHVGNAFNDTFEQGYFDTYGSPFGGGAYFMNTADLNNDNRTDLIISDDGGDRYLLNQGAGSDEVADFFSFAYQFHHTGVGGPAVDDGFGGQNIAADLDRDGWQDVLITPNDVEIPGCGRRMHIYRNLGGTPGGFVTLQEQTSGSTCNIPGINSPSCIVASIPASELVGVFDVATVDINGDGGLDLVVGRCSGTEVWINQLPEVSVGQIEGSDPASMLRLARIAGGDEIQLTWGDSCSPFDTEFNVYEGSLGSFQSHVSRACHLDAQTLALVPAAEARYYLVVPSNGSHEGSYGTTSEGVERPPGLQACDPQRVGECD